MSFHMLCDFFLKWNKKDDFENVLDPKYLSNHAGLGRNDIKMYIFGIQII